MKKKKVKGINTPELFIRWRGFIDCKLLKMAKINDDGVIISHYLTNKYYLFKSYMSQIVQELEESTSSSWEEMKVLLTEYKNTSIQKLDASMVPKTIEEKRMVHNIDVDNKNNLKQRVEIVNRLKRLMNNIESKELIVSEELNVVRHKIYSMYSSYGHGMRRRPVEKSMIPQIEIDDAFNSYLTTHSQTRKLVEQILNKEDQFDETIKEFTSVEQ